MKGAVFFVFLILILSVLLGGAFPVTAQESTTTYGPQWKSVCQGYDCETTIYSYEKYWIDESGNYEEIDEVCSINESVLYKFNGILVMSIGCTV